jgi:GT2 family glycosyltransferase
MYKISFIIVNYKSWTPLKECLDSIVSLKGNANFEYEVIIIDNKSNDNKLESFASLYPGYNFIENEGNYGFSNGNNLGARYATGDYLLFLNPDTIVSEKPLNYLLNFANNNPEYSIYSLQQKRPSGSNEYPFNSFPSFWTVNSILKSLYEHLSGSKLKKKCDRNEVIYPDWVSGSFVFIRKNIFHEIGGWDEDFWLYSEDTDLCKRARDKAGPVALLCRQNIIHKHAGSTRSNTAISAFFKAHVHISKHIYFNKHYKGINNFLIQLFFMLNAMLLEKLIPAMAGLIFFPVAKLRKYPFIYIYLLKYYINSLIKGSWLIDIKNIKIPGENNG